MSEMKERVASAIREELRKICYGVGTINAGQLADVLAPVAIEAMREPTEAMVAAVRRAKPHDMDLTEAWPIAIDEALK